MTLDFLREFEFFTGVPDSQLKALCSYLYDEYGVSARHIIAANEGNAVALAAGYHLATGKTPVVYLQNSGLGNIVNPAASLLNGKVYGIPCLFIVGWRGEPGVHDEPQHRFQGEITLSLLEDLDLPAIARACGYPGAVSVETAEELDRALTAAKAGHELAFIEVKCALGAREDLGRPTTTPIENKQAFMEFLRGELI